LSVATCALSRCCRSVILGKNALWSRDLNRKAVFGVRSGEDRERERGDFREDAKPGERPKGYSFSDRNWTI